MRPARAADAEDVKDAGARAGHGWRARHLRCNLGVLLDVLSLMIGRRTTAAWAPAILAVFALLFASSPVTAWETPAAAMSMPMAPADGSSPDAPCDPVKMSCARLCAVLCHGLVPTPAAAVPVAASADVHDRLPADALAGVEAGSGGPAPSNLISTDDPFLRKPIHGDQQ